MQNLYDDTTTFSPEHIASDYNEILIKVMVECMTVGVFKDYRDGVKAGHWCRHSEIEEYLEYVTDYLRRQRVYLFMGKEEECKQD